MSITSNYSFQLAFDQRTKISLGVSTLTALALTVGLFALTYFQILPPHMGYLAAGSAGVLTLGLGFLIATVRRKPIPLNESKQIAPPALATETSFTSRKSEQMSPISKLNSIDPKTKLDIDINPSTTFPPTAHWPLPTRLFNLKLPSGEIVSVQVASFREESNTIEVDFFHEGNWKSFSLNRCYGGKLNSLGQLEYPTTINIDDFNNSIYHGNYLSLLKANRLIESIEDKRPADYFRTIMTSDSVSFTIPGLKEIKELEDQSGFIFIREEGAFLCPTEQLELLKQFNADWAKELALQLSSSEWHYKLPKKAQFAITREGESITLTCKSYFAPKRVY